ncbi:MAG: hypothetical protein RL318_2289 [Fibrobacterota bacterium]
MSVKERLALLQEAREALPEKEPVRRWLERMLLAARDSLACGLDAQALRLCDRSEAVLERARARLALEEERNSMKIELEWEPVASDVGAFRKELSLAIRAGKYALPPVEVPQVLERVATLALPELMELRSNLSWRRLRFLRSRRRPWNKPRTATEEATIGLYNRVGVTGDVLEMAARQAPLWVDDLLELECRFASIDAMLGLK